MLNWGVMGAGGIAYVFCNAMRFTDTEQISRAFLSAITTGDSAHLHSTFSSSMNSRAAVLGANASDQLGGERIELKDFLVDDKYDRFRQKPLDQ